MSFPEIVPDVVKNAENFGEAKKCYPFRDQDIMSGVPIVEALEGYSPVVRNNASKDGLITNYFEGIGTVYEAFEEGRKFHGENEFLGRREQLADGKWGEYQWVSYNEVAAVRDHLGSGLVTVLKGHGVGTEGLILTLYSGNTFEWIVTDLACHAYSIVDTTLYDSLGPESSQYILGLTKSPIVVLSKANIGKVLEIKETARDSLGDLKVLVSMEELASEKDQELVKQAKSLGLELLTFNEVVDIGKKNPVAHIPPKPDDLLTISFTSGTVGTPKGVELTHRMFVCGITVCFCQIDLTDVVSATSFCFLPLAHVLERFKFAFEFAFGAKVALAHDPTDTRTYLEDIKELKTSSHLCGVPRVYSKIEQGVRAKFKLLPGLKGTIIRSVVAFKQFWDFSLGFNGRGYVNKAIKKLFLDKVRAQVGFGDLNFFISGGAPLNASSVRFLRSAFSCSFYVGYGLTESFATAFISNKYETNIKSSGPVAVATEMRLRDVPELGYSWAKNRSGEIQLRGPQIFKQYYKNPEKTAEAFDEDWFNTGDIGELDPDYKIKIVDRVKNIFKLSQGEYIAAEKIENDYLSTSEYMEQLFVYGSSLKDHLVAIAAVTPEAVFKYIQRAKGREDLVERYKEVFALENVEQVEEALQSKNLALRKFLLSGADELVKPFKLAGYEKIKNVYFLVDPLTLENNCITPTMKMKRQVAKNVHKANIDAMYEEGPI